LCIRAFGNDSELMYSSWEDGCYEKIKQTIRLSALCLTSLAQQKFWHPDHMLFEVTSSCAKFYCQIWKSVTVMTRVMGQAIKVHYFLKGEQKCNLKQFWGQGKPFGKQYSQNLGLIVSVLCYLAWSNLPSTGVGHTKCQIITPFELCIAFFFPHDSSFNFTMFTTCVFFSPVTWRYGQVFVLFQINQVSLGGTWIGPFSVEWPDNSLMCHKYIYWTGHIHRLPKQANIKHTTYIHK